MRNNLLLLLLCLVLNTQILANTFQHISTDSGLDHPFVRSIVQGEDGLMWIATLKSVSLFDGYELKKLKGAGFDRLKKVTTMEVMPGLSKVMLGTVEAGIFVTDGITINEIQWQVVKPTEPLNDMVVVDEQIWLFYPNEIFITEGSVVTQKLLNPLQQKTFSTIYNKNSGVLWLAGTDRVFNFNVTEQKLQEIPIISDSKNRRKLTLELDQGGQLWLGRSDGLYLMNEACRCFQPAFDVFAGQEISDLASINTQLWIATPLNGLYMYDFSTEVSKHFQKGDISAGQISDNSILELYAGNNDMLWLGTFNDGFNFIDTKVLEFNQMSNQNSGLACSLGSMVFDLYEHEDGSVWLATDKGLVRYHEQEKDCESFEVSGLEELKSQTRLIYSIFPFQNDVFWLNTSQGLLSFDLSTNKYSQMADQALHVSNYFISKYQNDQYFLGTTQGLFIVDNHLKSWRLIPFADNLSKNLLVDQHIFTNGEHWFGAQTGVFKLIDNKLVSYTFKTEKQDEVKYITGMASDGQGGFLLASEEAVLIHVDASGLAQDLSELFVTGDNQPIIYEMFLVGEWFWLSSDSGIYKLNLTESMVHHYGPEDGSIKGGFIKNSGHLGASGRLYFGGKHGLVGFKPEAIKSNLLPPKVNITNLFQLDKKLVTGDQLLGGFKLSKDINLFEKMQLNHKDIAFGFEFAALDYASPADNQYAYRLRGFNETWNPVSAENRLASYTNLSPGQYTFEVKAANKDGVWSTEPKSLAITVKPAPWFSPWAYALYALALITAIFIFIRQRTASARQRAVELEAVVTERTQELKTQKQMVESLLDHKNELFANVTHEFKTPLALIKGPTEQLLAESDLYPHKAKLNMVMRNANRLLVMVGQILKLSEVEQDKVVVREYQDVKPVLDMLFESFKPLAADKNITLQLDNTSTTSIYGTPELLEMVVGNLLSNAIKYTQTGGHVTLTSRDQGDQVIIEVSDTGAGIAAADQDIIFNRFTRLDSHRDIQGTGIGLAVVKEITQANGGHIRLSSEIGRGSTFSIQLNAVENIEQQSHESEMLTELVSNTHNEMRTVQSPQITKRKTHDITILVIEDNLDMQTHIGDVLAKHFDCLFADRGKQGVAMALKDMPDIVICDVMMPGMDGFQVTRILRNDANTSHIPVVLLTALNTKESRIKGWRENIDVYLTKPFDGKELQATIHAILSVRKILQQKTQASLSVAGTTEALDLPAQDLKFINKLKTVIADNYQNPMFMRPQIASLLAVSERQLQRKVKALIDDSPMSLLRSYRLEMAANKLNDGFQVSIVGDECGFSSVSYFAACFKKKYGMTPKKYQMLNQRK